MESGTAISRWQMGPVDRRKEHFELRYGSAEDDDWNDWIPMAIVGPPVAGVVSVQFIVELTDQKTASAVDRVKKEINFYLLELKEANPWRYAQYHCTTSSNVFGDVNWSFFDPETGSPLHTTMEDSSLRVILSKFSVYAGGAEDSLASAVIAGGTAVFSDVRDWMIAKDLLNQANADGEAMPVIFVARPDCSQLAYWGVLADIKMKGASTEYSVTHLRKIMGQHSAQELVRVIGGPVDPDSSEPDVICLTPPFLSINVLRGLPTCADAWDRFTSDLALCLSDLSEGEFIVVSVKDMNYFVQFSAQGHFGMRAEATSNNYISSEEVKLSASDYVNMSQSGWNYPTEAPDSPHTPDGSPNFFVELLRPVDFGYLAHLAAHTLRTIYRVDHPSKLQYKSFGPDIKIRFPSFCIEREK